MADDTGAPARRKAGVLSRKIGPLPAWGWVAIVAVLIIVWAWWHNKNTQNAGTPAGTASADVPQFVNQTYTSPYPPPPPASGGGADDDDDGKGKGSGGGKHKRPHRKHPHVPPLKHPHHGRRSYPGGAEHPPEPKPIRGPVHEHGGPPVRRILPPRAA